MFTIFGERRTAGLSKVGGDAYKDSLAKHHGWALQGVVKTGMYTLPYRETFIKSW